MCSQIAKKNCGGSACQGLCRNKSRVERSISVLWLILAAQKLMICEKPMDGTPASIAAEEVALDSLDHLLQSAHGENRFDQLVLIGPKERTTAVRTHLSERMQNLIIAEIEQEILLDTSIPLPQQLQAFAAF